MNLLCLLSYFTCHSPIHILGSNHTKLFIILQNAICLILSCSVKTSPHYLPKFLVIWSSLNLQYSAQASHLVAFLKLESKKFF